MTTLLRQTALQSRRIGGGGGGGEGAAMLWRCTPRQVARPACSTRSLHRARGQPSSYSSGSPTSPSSPTSVPPRSRGLASPLASSFAHLPRGRASFSSTSAHQNASPASSPSLLLTYLAASSLAALALWSYYDLRGVKLLPLTTARADEPAGIPTHAELDETPVHLDPDTSMAFPAILSTPNTSEDLKLTGLGVRTVSFLRVQVYSVGTYFSPQALDKVKTLDKKEGESLVASILDLPYDMAIRIVPVKTTDHSHLRDGFVRAMLARIKLATKSGAVNEAQAEAAGSMIETFKGFFPAAKLPKGNSLLLIRRGSDGALLLEYEGKLLGTLQNPFLAKELMLAYFADNGKEISSKMKADVLAGLERYR